MTYASKADIETLYGAEFIADILDENVDADAAFADALDRASAEIDVHLSARYPLPLTTAPKALVTPCCNMAIYHLAMRHTYLTDTITQRYKDAVDLLKRIADGKAGLGVDEPSVSGDPDVSESGASFSANGRLFTRGTLL